MSCSCNSSRRTESIHWPARHGLHLTHPVLFTRQQPLRAGKGNHRAVIGAEASAGVVNLGATFFGLPCQPLTQA